MRNVVRPPIEAASRERSSDDLDALLHDYFHAQMPQPWPEWQPPPTVLPARRWWSSRFALAATVAFLLFGSLALSAAFRASNPDPTNLPSRISAQGDPLHLLKELPPEAR
jgi:hypothetical protein